jgi:negative regulator of sigma E activity
MRTELRHGEIEELLGAFALDALEADEADMVGRHLPTCARCRSEVEEYREVAALLAHTGAAAPAGLWDRIASSLEGEPPAFDRPPAPFLPRAVPASDAPPSALSMRRSWQTRVAGTVIAAAAAVIVVLGVQMSAQDERLDEMAEVLALDALERAYQAAEGTPGSAILEMTSFDGSIDTQAVVTPDGRGYLQAANLPELAEGRTYQLWGDTGEQRVSLGPLGADPQVVSFELSDGYIGLAITEEAEPGVIVSDQPVLAYGQLPS